jgi:putative serine protease PepD
MSENTANDDEGTNQLPPPPPAIGPAAAPDPAVAPGPLYPPPSFTQPLHMPPAGGAGGGSPSSSANWRRAAIAGAAGLVIALAAGGVGGFVGYALHGDNSPLQTVSDSGNRVAAPVVDRSSLAQIAASVQPSVVVIDTGSGEGSGVIISADGYVVTNNHVVSGARGSTVQVTFNSGKRVQASIVGTDPRTDLAVVKASGAVGLKFATWGDSDAVQVGDTVLAIGSPLGLQGSVTAGIVSALHRTITVGDNQQSPFDTGSARTTIGDAIQTDAPINPGNSGGALVNTEGKVIGINSAIATSGSTGNIGVGFAISANKAKSVADQLIKGGKVSHPFLGVSVGNADNGGAQVQQVQAGGPADKAGLKVGDVIVKVNDRTVASREDLVGAIQGGTVGATVKLTIVRGATQQVVTATLGEAQ